MGIHVKLYINPAGIEPGLWARIHDETLALLEAWPVPLLGRGTRTIEGERIAMYLRSLRHGSDAPVGWTVAVTGRVTRPLSARHSIATCSTTVLGRSVGLARISSPTLPIQSWNPSADQHGSLGTRPRVTRFTSRFSRRQCSSRRERRSRRLSLAILTGTRRNRRGAGSGHSGARSAGARHDRCATAPGPPRRPLQKESRSLGPLTASLWRAGGGMRFCFERFPVRLERRGGLQQVKAYRTPDCVGVTQLLVDWLNAGRPLRRACQLACLKESGPRFKPETFIDALRVDLDRCRAVDQRAAREGRQTSWGSTHRGLAAGPDGDGCGSDRAKAPGRVGARRPRGGAGGRVR